MIPNLWPDPWQEIRTRRRGHPHGIPIPCPVCGRRARVRYWDAERQRAVCIDCVPESVIAAGTVRRISTPPTDPPMALD